MGKKQKHIDHPTVAELRQELYKNSQAMDAAYERFNWADDPDMIDACIFEINACKARSNYLLRQMKERCGEPIHRPHAVPVPQYEPQVIPCAAACQMKGGDLCRS